MRAARAEFQEKLFDVVRGVYRVGKGTDLASQHANFLPLAFGLVSEEESAHVTAYFVWRGMPCSVYAA